MQEKSRYFIELAYDGTAYHGWQRQPQSISVQEVLEDGLQKMLREK
jgi:tRNA pseudouridine38-40 synthase